MKKFLPIFFIVALALLVVFKGVFKPNVLGASTAGPSGPNGLRAYPGPGKGEVTLEWQRSSLFGENFSIHYGTGTGYYQNTASYVGYVATYTVSGLEPGKRYYFGLERIWIGNVSQGIGAEVTMVAPTVPTTVIGTAGPIGRNLLHAVPGPKSGEVTLSWRKYFSDSVGYSIVYGDLPGKYIYGAVNAVNVTDTSGNDFSYTVKALKPGNRYYFAIVPVRSGIGGIYVTAEVSTVSR